MRKKILIASLMLLASQLGSALVCWLLFGEVFLAATFAATLPVIILVMYQTKLGNKSS